jgi:cation:H+ antiporter
MSLLIQIIGGIAGIVFLYYGAEFLIKGGVSIALKFKVSSLVIGLTLVAFGTSAPEFVVSLQAALNNHGDISIGNVVGSNICNIALILGLCAMISPLKVNPSILKFDGILMIVASCLLALFYGLNSGVNRIEGAILFAGLLGFLAWSFYTSKKEEKAAQESQNNLAEQNNNQSNQFIDNPKIYSNTLSLIFVIGGLAFLVIGAKLFVDSAVYIAKVCKVSDAVIGLTIVAVGTSLPELATSLVAAIKHEEDIAIGNVIGSNIFNILGILGVAPLISPIKTTNISWVDMGIMITLAVILYPMMKSKHTISRVEGGILLVLYIGYIFWLLCQK